MYDVEVRDRPARRVIGLAHTGAYQEIGPTFAALSAQVTELGLWPEAQEFLGLYFDDPGEVPEDDLRALAGIAVRDDLALPDGLEQTRLTAGKYAVLSFKGPYEGLPDAWAWLYNDWLPASGERPGPGIACEVYVNSPTDVAPEDLRTDICAPLV
jgi:AraC family transcriptional regulator